GGQVEPVSLKVLMLDAEDLLSAREQLAGPDPVTLRARTLQLSPTKFLSLFKRFHLAMALSGADLNGREYEIR
ncbi:hypothetical protein WDZ92_49275, partial [Nostoc sp. NIES-2111]